MGWVSWGGGHIGLRMRHCNKKNKSDFMVALVWSIWNLDKPYPSVSTPVKGDVLST
jgi:hypothetical protein